MQMEHRGQGWESKRASQFLLQTLLGGGGRAVRLRQRHDAVRALQVGLQGLLIGRLQRLEQVLRLPAVVTMETPVASTGEGEGRKRKTDFNRESLPKIKRHFLLPVVLHKSKLLWCEMLSIGDIVFLFNIIHQDAHVVIKTEYI